MDFVQWNARLDFGELDNVVRIVMGVAQVKEMIIGAIERMEPALVTLAVMTIIVPKGAVKLVLVIFIRVAYLRFLILKIIIHVEMAVFQAFMVIYVVNHVKIVMNV